MKSLVKSLIGRVPMFANRVRRQRDQAAMRSLTWNEVSGYGFVMLGGNWFAAGDYAAIGGGLHEAQEVAIVADCLSNCDALIDVGANSGLFSLIAASRGKPAIALEPMHDNIEILLRNIDRNKFGDRIEVLPVGAGDRVGVLPFYGSGQVASLVAGWGSQLTATPTLVPVNTLDNLLADRFAAKSVFIKIDVEGAELAVLDGATRLLAQTTGLLIENSLEANHPGGFNPAFETIFQRLWATGYDAFVADLARTPVSPAMLSRWIAEKRLELGTENFLFLRR